MAIYNKKVAPIFTIIKLKQLGLLKDIKYHVEDQPTARPDEELPSPGRQRILVGQGSNMVSYILRAGGSKEDLLDAIRFTFGCMDLLKYRLSYGGLVKKYNYPELYLKYTPEENFNATLLRKLQEFRDTTEETK